jgi:hypothetical protein
MAASQLVDALLECGDEVRGEAVRRFALGLCTDAKARSWLEEDVEDEGSRP